MLDCKYELVQCIVRAYISAFMRALIAVNQCWFAKLFTVVLGDLENINVPHGLNFRIQDHLFRSLNHKSAGYCVILQKILTPTCVILQKILMHVKQVARSGPAFSNCFQKSPTFCLFSTWRTNDFFFLNGNNFSDQKGSVIGPIRAAMNIPWEQNCQRNVTCGCLKYAVDCETSKATEYSFLGK